MDSKSFGIKIGISAIVIVATIGALVFLLQEGDAQYNTYTGTPKALIIDQLYFGETARASVEVLRRRVQLTQ